MPYKDAEPDVTVNRIISILRDLDISTAEKSFVNYNSAFSCRISIQNKGLASLNIGTNGKGLTHDYSRASGYAELMERVQNKFLFNEALRFADKVECDRPLQFRFFPDEKKVIFNIDAFFKTLNNIFPHYDYSQKERVSLHYGRPNIESLCVPFARFCKDGNSVEMVPIVLARANSSTGMCAGNTPEEAILQGINEIFERYVLQQIYLKPITPPSFPDGYFEGTLILQKLQGLREFGYNYVIKDFSLGQGFPVVGLVLTNTKNGTTMFRLGADMDPVIALERCYTEIFQGRSTSEHLFLKYHPKTSFAMENNLQLLKREYKKSLRDGTGLIPHHVFFGTPSWPFTPPRHKRNGDTNVDLKMMMAFLYERGFSVLVRDNSFLGFNTYHIIIPGLSDQHYNLRNILEEYFSNPGVSCGNDCISFEAHHTVWPLYAVKSNDDLRSFLKGMVSEEIVKLAPYCDSPHNFINKSLLLFLFSIKNNDYSDAESYYEDYMVYRKNRRLSYNEYLDCVGHYVYLKSIDATKQTIISWLSQFFSDEVVEEVLSDFQDTSAIMKNYAFPTCFDCQACPVRDHCRFTDVIALERKVQAEQIRNVIDQKKLFTIIDN